FVQDDWRAGRNLTLNLGLRWDFETGTEETHGQITRFDPSANSQLNIGPSDDSFVRALRPNLTDVRGLLTFPSGPQTSTRWNRFAPRVGFAYRLNDKTTIRGGYGLSFVPQSLEQGTALGVNVTTSVSQSADPNGQVIPFGSAASPTINLADPFRNALTLPAGRSLGADTQIGQSPLLVEPNQPNSYIGQYNFVVQRALPGSVVIDVAYVGSHGVRLPFPSLNLNQLPVEYLDYGRANFAAARDVNGVAAANLTQFFSQQVNNPFFGLITNPNSPLSSRTVRRDQLLKPFPQYDNPQLYRPAIGASKYNGLQVSVRKRFSNGLVALANYTFSKLIDIGGAGNNNGGGGGSTIEDIYNPAIDYTLSNVDVPHRFTTSFTYELPFARKRGALMRGIAGGWQTSGTATYQSGTPVGVTAPGFGLSYAVRRANRVSGVQAGFDTGTTERNIRDGGYAFNPDAFTQPPEFTLGTAARNYGDVRRDPYKNVNLGILKNFYFAEARHKLQLRGEFINAFNMVVFGTPGRDVSQKDLIQNGVVVRQGTFARVSTQGNTPRNIQLVLRYTF
ncbi:MAG: TonB-dependent receptor, partial [Acidobacteriota bacterium]|nr:TonB-dependent receptor [Acidobacteriota bacterium]